MIEVGDLVMQRAPMSPIINEMLRGELNFDCIGIVMDVIKIDYLYQHNDDCTNVIVKWSNGKIEELPSIYLEVIKSE